MLHQIHVVTFHILSKLIYNKIELLNRKCTPKFLPWNLLFNTDEYM